MFAPLFLDGMTQSFGYPDWFSSLSCARVIRAINSMMRTFYFAQYVLKPTTTVYFFHWTLFVIFQASQFEYHIAYIFKGHPPSPSEVLGMTQSWGVLEWVFQLEPLTCALPIYFRGMSLIRDARYGIELGMP